MIEGTIMKRHGFTLIELLVVIAILALSMAILLPALNKARELGQGIACKVNLKNYGYAVHLYAEDNDDRFVDPRSCYFSREGPYPVEAGINAPKHVRWCNGDVYLRNHPEYAGPFYTYFQTARAFICPTFAPQAFENKEDRLHAEIPRVKNFLPWYNYTMNAYLGTPEENFKKSRALKRSEVKRPAEVFSFTEESTWLDPLYSDTGLNDTYMYIGPDARVLQWLSQTGGYRQIKAGPAGVGPMGNVIAGFHHAPTGDPLAGKGNCVFLDGHVSAHQREDTFVLAWPR